MLTKEQRDEWRCEWGFNGDTARDGQVEINDLLDSLDEMERERDAFRENSHRGWEVRDASYVALEHAHDDLKASRDYWLDQSEALKRERAVLANERDEWKARAERQRIIISAIGDHILENQGGEVDAAVGSAVQSIDASTDLTYSSVRDILHDAV